MYEALHNTKPSSSLGEDELIIFPIGVANIPPGNIDNTKNIRKFMIDQINKHFQHKSPKQWETIESCISTMIFRYLDPKHWTSSHETLGVNFIQEYIQQVTKIVNWLNDAKVSHNDLLPRNILWAVINGKLRVVLIDFEDACFFDHIKPPIAYDHRYPFFHGILPSKRANDFFLFYIKKFVQQRTTFSFSDFMSVHGKILYGEFLGEGLSVEMDLAEVKVDEC